MFKFRSLLWMLLVGVIMIGCERPIPLESDSEDSYYRQAESQAPGGTGRYYMGREIAYEKGIDGADWLERPGRETAELPQRVLVGLELRPTDNVADIGAGTGYFTFRISERVPAGTVHAVEFHDSLQVRLREKIHALDSTNIIVHESTFNSPGLPSEEIDVALLANSYHEFTHPREIGRALIDALRPGGKVIVVEYREEDSTLPVESIHRMSEEQVKKEFEDVGFRWRETRDFLPQQHFVVFEKPFEDM